MLSFTSLLCLLSFLWTQIDLYNAQRPYICCKSVHNEDTCKFYENPVLIPLFQSRINNQKCYPAYSPNRCQKCVGGEYRKRDINLSPRSNLYLSNLLQGGKKSVFPKDNINFGYLNFNDNVKSIGDLMELNSDEIEIPRPVLRKEPVKLWKLDEVKSMSVPKLLPDVVIESDNYEGDNGPFNLREGVIDEHDKKLGRFVVEDDPPMPMNVGKPKRSQSNPRVDNSGLNEQYITAPSNNIPEVRVDKVTALKEPDFMEQLQLIKLAARTPPTYVEYPYIENVVTEVPYIEEYVTEVPYKESVADIPSTSMEAEELNWIEKEINTKITHKSDDMDQEVRKKNKKVEVLESPTAVVTAPSISTSVVVVTPPTVSSSTAVLTLVDESTPASEETDKVKITKREKDPITLSRFSEHEETLLDGLLSVM